jgi:hypothetical protein
MEAASRLRSILKAAPLQTPIPKLKHLVQIAPKAWDCCVASLKSRIMRRRIFQRDIATFLHGRNAALSPLYATIVGK